jgi:hypothetical protein
MLDKMFLLAMLYESALSTVKFERWSEAGVKHRVNNIVWYIPSLLLVAVMELYFRVWSPLHCKVYAWLHSKKVKGGK